MDFHLLSAGAAKGVVTAMQPEFEAATGARLHGTFGAVGAIRDKLLAGFACDALILTRALVAGLAREGRIVEGTCAPLGKVRTGIAVPKGWPQPHVEDPVDLRKALLEAEELYLPDPDRATAGIHCIAMLKRMGIAGEMAPRLRPFPHGAAAMQALAKSRARRAIGCTQVTEINDTPGVTLVGALPPPFELETVYSVGVVTTAAEPEVARRFAAWVAGPQTHATRAAAGFDDAP